MDKNPQYQVDTRNTGCFVSMEAAPHWGYLQGYHLSLLFLGSFQEFPFLHTHPWLRSIKEFRLNLGN